MLYSPLLQKSKNLVNNYKKDRLNYENYFIKRRLIDASKNFLNHDIYENDFKNHLYFKKFNKSFNLPEITSKTYFFYFVIITLIKEVWLLIQIINHSKLFISKR